MTQMTTITFGSRRIAIHGMSGEVMDTQKWTTTEISGGGGEGVIHNGSGYIQHEEVKSKTTTHDQIIIRTADGEEESLKVEDMHLVVRRGHWVSLIWAIVGRRKDGPFVAVFNHNTGSLDFIGSGVNKACFPMISSVFGAGGVLSRADRRLRLLPVERRFGRADDGSVCRLFFLVEQAPGRVHQSGRCASRSAQERPGRTPTRLREHRRRQRQLDSGRSRGLNRRKQQWTGQAAI
jgi:hypothetical protein